MTIKAAALTSKRLRIIVFLPALCLLAHRASGPDRIEREMGGFPKQIPDRDDRQIDPDSRQPGACPGEFRARLIRLLVCADDH
ncbi:MAG: hypothetical protein U0987_00155 [Afipia sp.]|nr:hypothetical protein [Afipia sp.]